AKPRFAVGELRDALESTRGRTCRMRCSGSSALGALETGGLPACRPCRAEGRARCRCAPLEIEPAAHDHELQVERAVRSVVLASLVLCYHVAESGLAGGCQGHPTKRQGERVDDRLFGMSARKTQRIAGLRELPAEPAQLTEPHVLLRLGRRAGGR